MSSECDDPGNEWAASASRTGGQAQSNLGELKKSLTNPTVIKKLEQISASSGAEIQLPRGIQVNLEKPLSSEVDADLMKGMAQLLNLEEADAQQLDTQDNLRRLLGNLIQQSETGAQEATPEQRTRMDNLLMKVGISKLLASASEESATEESIESKNSAV